jgi:aminoglycoside phosphotransferase (APT) family kinase protein
MGVGIVTQHEGPPTAPDPLASQLQRLRRAFTPNTAHSPMPTTPTQLEERHAADIAYTVAGSYGYRPEDLTTINRFGNCVVIAAEQLVFKVPQNNHPDRLENLDTERVNLRALERVNLAPIATPRLIASSDGEPRYLVVSYVPGRASIPKEEIQAQDTAVRERLGRQIGEHIVRQTTSIDPASAWEVPPRSSEENWRKAFDLSLSDFSSAAYPTLSRMAAQIYAQWQAYRQTTPPKRFIHADLTLDNIGLSDTYKLVSVFDYGRASVGTLAEELNPLINIDEAVLRGAMDELDANGLAPNPEEVWLWRNMKDLYVLPYWIRQNETDHPFFIKVREIITARFPDLDWSELY